MDDTESPVTNIESMYEEEQIDGGPTKTMDMSYAINPNLAEEDIAQLQIDGGPTKTMDMSYAINPNLAEEDIAQLQILIQPVTCKPYRLPYAQRDIVKQTVDELLQAGIVRASNSAYASPVVLFGKRAEGTRMCVDYRRLNSITNCKKEYMVPISMEELDHLAHKKYFPTLDLASGYYQVPVAEGSRQFTAFVTNDGSYEFTRMPFGLVNAPSVFHRLMRKVFAELGPESVTIYMDNILIASESVDEGLEKLGRVFGVLNEEGLTLNLKKCRFLLETVEYLGMEIDCNGVRTRNSDNLYGRYPDRKWFGPETVTIYMDDILIASDSVDEGLEKLGGVFGVLKEEGLTLNLKKCRFLFETVEYLGMEIDCNGVRPGEAKINVVRNFKSWYGDRLQWCSPRKNEEWEWTANQEEAFQKTKDVLTQRPVLALYNPEGTFEVHTDASKRGLAGILLQRMSDTPLKPVAYFSRQTSDFEERYHSYELETLAVVDSDERFRIYLLSDVPGAQRTQGKFESDYAADALKPGRTG
ncbi:Reverse transcriptase (RNA-dependent DNA polymerase) [Popillia japonica]|uniref:Reverse transcriptase (RNA-dependent DNA polymerase) n=1 Tax=Popillia japonica TaxID=7064 RepID=A0AAW1N0Y6_POPJA